jgi:hypothetical protein
MQAPPAAAGNGQQQQQQGFSWRGVIFQLVVMYFIFSYLFGGNKQATVDPSTGKAVQPHRPLWHGGERMQLRVFHSENEEMTPEEFKDPDALLWSEDQLFYDWRPENERFKDIVIKASPVRFHPKTSHAPSKPHHSRECSPCPFLARPHRR